MKNPESTKIFLSRRSFMKSVAPGGGALYLLGKMGNPLTAQDLEVFSEPKRAKDINAASGSCQCGGSECGGGGGGGSCQCGGSKCGGGGY